MPRATLGRKRRAGRAADEALAGRSSVAQIKNQYIYIFKIFFCGFFVIAVETYNRNACFLINSIIYMLACTCISTKTMLGPEYFYNPDPAFYECINEVGILYHTGLICKNSYRFAFK